MKVRSTASFDNKLSLAKKAVYFGIAFVVGAFIFNILISMCKQVIVQKKIGRNLAKKQAELRLLEEENSRLKSRLQEVGTLSFLDEEAARLLGMSRNGLPLEKENKKEELSRPVEQIIVPNYQKWFDLFKD